MPLYLNRKRCDPDGIFGELADESGERIAYTLEHSFDCVPKLPAGTYQCVRGSHTLHSGPIETFEITGVPAHSGILFHYGNFDDDSDGCVLLGMGQVGNMITHSREAFAAFMDLCDGLDSFTLFVS